jgi:peptidoglycan hydrolase CwlO-like protein
MKKILMLTILMIVTILSKAQTNTDLPQYLIEGGDTIGIIISVEQAQILDNDVELLELFKKLRINCDNLDTHYVEVINAQNEQIALLKVNTKELQGQGVALNSQIENLKEKVQNSEKKNKLCDEELLNKDEEIKILKKEIFKQKVKKIISVTGNAILVVVTTILIIKS